MRASYHTGLDADHNPRRVLPRSGPGSWRRAGDQRDFPRSFCLPCHRHDPLSGATSVRPPTARPFRRSHLGRAGQFVLREIAEGIITGGRGKRRKSDSGRARGFFAQLLAQWHSTLTVRYMDGCCGPDAETHLSLRWWFGRCGHAAESPGCLLAWKLLHFLPSIGDAKHLQAPKGICHVHCQA